MTTTVLLRETATLTFNGITLTGAIAYQPATGLLSLIHEDGQEEDLSVSLTAHGYIPSIGEAIIPNYSEHTGLPQALTAAGIAEPIETITFGPFNTTATRMALTIR